MSDKETAPCRPYMDRLLKKLADPSEAFHYINAAWQESPEVFVQAVEDVAQAVAVECTAPEFWKKEALALVVLLRAKCSDEEWANMESRFEAPVPQPANYALALDVVDAIEWIDQNEPKRARDVLAEVRDKLRTAAPQITPALVQGSWPKNCPQRHFVQGASWWQFHSQGSTMFASERDQAEAEAVKRFGPVEGTSEQASPDTIDDGFGNAWSAYCPTCKQKSMYVSGPGDARCAKCETKQASSTPEK